MSTRSAGRFIRNRVAIGMRRTAPSFGAAVLFCYALTLICEYCAFSGNLVLAESSIDRPGTRRQEANSPAAPQADLIQIPAGTVFRVRLLLPVLRRSTIGINAELTNQINVEDRVVFPKGTLLHGHATLTKNPVHSKNRGYISLLLDQIQTIDGTWIDIKTTPVLARIKSQEDAAAEREEDSNSSNKNDGAARSFAEANKDIAFPAGKKLSFALTTILAVPK